MHERNGIVLGSLRSRFARRRMQPSLAATCRSPRSRCAGCGPNLGFPVWVCLLPTLPWQAGVARAARGCARLVAIASRTGRMLPTPGPNAPPPAVAGEGSHDVRAARGRDRLAMTMTRRKRPFLGPLGAGLPRAMAVQGPAWSLCRTLEIVMCMKSGRTLDCRGLALTRRLQPLSPRRLSRAEPSVTKRGAASCPKAALRFLWRDSGG